MRPSKKPSKRALRSLIALIAAGALVWALLPGESPERTAVAIAQPQTGIDAVPSRASLARLRTGASVGGSSKFAGARRAIDTEEPFETDGEFDTEEQFDTDGEFDAAEELDTEHELDADGELETGDGLDVDDDSEELAPEGQPDPRYEAPTLREARGDLSDHYRQWLDAEEDPVHTDRVREHIDRQLMRHDIDPLASYVSCRTDICRLKFTMKDVPDLKSLRDIEAIDESELVIGSPELGPLGGIVVVYGLAEP